MSKNPVETSVQQRVVDLLKLLVREYAAFRDLDAEQLRHIKMRDFVAYVTKHSDWCYKPEVYDDLIIKLGLSHDDLRALYATLSDPWTASELLWPHWHMLVLSAQPPIMQIPSFFHLALTFVWDAGSGKEMALRIEVPTRWKDGSPLTNGFLCSFLQDQFRGILQSIAGNGLDKLYEKHALPVPPK